MRVVNEKIWEAIKHGRACKASINTRCDEDCNVYLHGHHIARLIHPTGSILLGNWEFNLCGWHTDHAGQA